MPTKVEYFTLYHDNGLEDQAEPPLEKEYSTREEAQKEADRLLTETGKKYAIWEADRWSPLEEEKQSQFTMFVLTREDCNGEYGINGHWSLHGTIDGAKETQAKLVNPADLKGEDATNEWRPCAYDDGVLTFRTGNWGYVVWQIRPLKLLK